MLLTGRRQRTGGEEYRDSSARATLTAAVLGFFMITLDAVVVSIALPSIRDDLGGGITGLQWVVDGYTLMFAALLLSAGALADRIGARRAFGAGLVLFAVASAACGLAPSLAALVAARFVQGTAAAVVMPAFVDVADPPRLPGPGPAGAGDRALGHGRRGRGIGRAGAGRPAHAGLMADDLLRQRADRRGGAAAARRDAAIAAPGGCRSTGRGR